MYRSVHVVLIAFGITAVLSASAWAQLPRCATTNIPPTGDPLATLVVNIHDHHCSSPCNGGNAPCCSNAATIELPAGDYIVTLDGQECSTEGPGSCFSDGTGTDSNPSCRQISWGTGNCASDSRPTNACLLCDPRVADGGPIRIEHPGGPFYAWRNDCYWGDNFGINVIKFYPVCFGDLNADRIVDLADLGNLLANFGTHSGATYTNGDLDTDDDVDLSDLTLLLANFGTICP